MQGQIGIASDTDRFAGDRNRAWAGRHPAWQLNGQFGNKLRFTVVVCFVLTAFTSPAQNAVATKAQSGFPVLEFVQNKVEVLRFGSKTWDVASTDTNHNTLHSGDRLRTGENSRVGLRLPEHRAMLILDANSYLIVPNEPQEKSSFELLSGRLFNFHRGTADEQRFKTPTVSAIVRGTDFELEVKPDNTTIVSMIDGQVYLKNSFGQIELKKGEEAVVQTGAAPRRTAAITTVNVVQWCFYYPGVLDLNELKLESDERETLKASLNAYRAGDLLDALSSYPALRKPMSDSEKIFHAALLLTVGQVEESESELMALPTGKQTDPLAESLRTLIAAMKREPRTSARSPQLATELLAASYYEQSRATGEESLKAALELARRATTVSPQFAFAWERVAEMQFCLGLNREARESLKRGQLLSPSASKAKSLQGFIDAADGDTVSAIRSFDEAIKLDGSIGEAWLGRGLCYYQQGRRKNALDDLQMAAALEPQHSLPRSYLAKIWSEKGDKALAEKEIILAESLDPKDPTAWLYAGLIHQRMNLPNQAIDDLQQSKAKNNNLAAFRSSQKLDQDLAVRSANLASVFQEAGLDYVALNEGARATISDYANYSGHLYLANYFDNLRDLSLRNFQYETPWSSEVFIANLLSPIGTGTLVGSLNQQMYSPLFNQNSWSFQSLAQYSSHGDYRLENAATVTHGNTEAAFDIAQITVKGYAPNTDVNLTEYEGRAKYQLGQNDVFSMYLIGLNRFAGSSFQYYDPADLAHLDTGYKTHWTLPPNVGLGWNHQWNNRSHTLLFGTLLSGSQTTTDITNPNVLAIIPIPPFVINPTVATSIHDSWFGFSLEFQQIQESDHNTLVLGARLIDSPSKNDSQTLLGNSSINLYVNNVADTWLSGYAYDFIKVCDSLHIIAGLAYEKSKGPANWDLVPVLNQEHSANQWSPKAGFSWQMGANTEAQGMIARSLGGTIYDASARLEPSQLVGFPDIDRGALPTVIQPYSGTAFTFWGLVLTHKFPERTYVSLQANGVQARAQGGLGGIDATISPMAIHVNEAYDYKKNSISLRADHLIGNGGIFGVSYQISKTTFNNDFNYPTVGDIYKSIASTWLQNIDMHCSYTDKSGWFLGANALAFIQGDDVTDGLSGGTFCQFNLKGGYWFPRRHARLEIDLLNIGDQNYRLNPLNIYPDLPRGRTLGLSFRYFF